MNCWSCNDKLIWGGDTDIEDTEEEFVVQTNLSCSSCQSVVIFYHHKSNF
tara:strand:- start:215 stop:364 length:150 start_codon:yes stop_codon:yes gene_type:complete